MRAFRLDTSMQGEQRLDDAELGLARGQNKVRAADLAPRVAEWGGARVRMAVRRPGFFSGPSCATDLLIFVCVRRPEKEPENGGTCEISFRRDRSGPFFK